MVLIELESEHRVAVQIASLEERPGESKSAYTMNDFYGRMRDEI